MKFSLMQAAFPHSDSRAQGHLGTVSCNVHIFTSMSGISQLLQPHLTVPQKALLLLVSVLLADMREDV